MVAAALGRLVLLASVDVAACKAVNAIAQCSAAQRRIAVGCLGSPEWSSLETLSVSVCAFNALCDKQGLIRSRRPQERHARVW